MNIRIRRTAATSLALWSVMSGGALAQRRSPALISPDGGDEDGRVATGCPTFSWTLVAEATGYELRVYEARAREEITAPSAAPRLRKEFPDGATSWTPALKECLPPGRYGWAVAALVGVGEPRWSQPGLFEVAARPPRTPAAPERREAATPLVLRGPPSSSAQAWSSPDSNRKQVGDEAYTPPLCGSGKFADVPAGSPFCRWIEQLDRDGIMSSCDGGSNFCPDNPVTRKQLAMALGKSTRGTATWHPAEGSNWLAPPAASIKTTLDDEGDVGRYTSITIGVDGLPIISYYDNTVEALKVAHCHDVACSGPKTISTVDNEGNLGGFTSITIGVDGLPIISYHDATVDFENGFYRQALKVAHCNDVACAGQDETLTFVHDTDQAVGYFTSIAIGADGLPIISHVNVSAGALLVTHCNDALCATPATTSTVDPSGVAQTNTSIAIDAGGRGLISYYGVNGDLKVAHCLDNDCTGAVITPLDTTNDVGQYTSITIGADGLGLISFVAIEQGSKWLKVAHCSNYHCTAATITPVTSASDPTYTSITIGADGLGVIAYANPIFGIIVVARCTNPLCTATTSALPAGGSEPAITIGADGLPLISYYDPYQGDLEVAHCSNVFCLPYFRRR